MGEYDDIINIVRPDSKRQKMDILERANIFNPFAALTGYEESINEAGRIVDKKLELDSDKQCDLNLKIEELLKESHFASVIYFKKDLKKEGGVYKSILGNITKVNLNDRILYIDSLKISFDDLYKIDFLEEQ